MGAWARILAFAFVTLSLALTVDGVVTTSPATAPTSRPFTFHSPQGYQLTLPAGWWAASADQVQRENRSLVKREAQAQNSIDAIFYRGSADLPRAMVRAQVAHYRSNSEPDEKEMRRIAQRFVHGDSSAKEDLTPQARQLAQRVQTTEGEFDATTLTFSFDASINDEILGRIKQQSIGHFGHTALVVVSCYAQEKALAAVEPEFRQIQQSFRLDADERYQGGSWGRMSIILGIAVLALIYLVFRLTYRRARSRP